METPTVEPTPLEVAEAKAKRWRMVAFCGMALATVLFVVYALSVQNQPVNQVTVPLYKNFTLLPDNKNFFYVGMYDGDGGIALTKYMVSGNVSLTPFGEGFVSMQDIDIPGYEFKKGEGGLLIIKSYDWEDVVTSWDLSWYGAFDDDGIFHPNQPSQ